MTLKIAILASRKRNHTPEVEALRKNYNAVDPKHADVIVTLGGDGFMLRMLHEHVNLGVPFFGLHRGTHGFLLNRFPVGGDLMDALENAHSVSVHPLRMRARTTSGALHDHLAFNEVSLLRTGVQASKLQISVDGKSHLPELVGDGVLVSTPIGSSAYNLSANGPILPLNANLLALTPICPFRPRRWAGALLEQEVKITCDILQAERRPVHAIADFHEVREIAQIDIALDTSVTAKLLFSSGAHLADRIRDEQFGF